MTKSWVPQFTHQDVEVLDEKEVYSGYCPIKEYKLRFRLFQGGWSHTVVRERILRPSAAAVLLYDPHTDQVVMIEQIRMGALALPNSPWILEIVAGLIDLGETPETTAKRESIEEAGCTIESLIHICTYLVSAGISDEQTTVYCGLIQAPKHGGLHGLLEDGEDIKVHVLFAEEVFELLKQGKISSASAVIAVQWLALNRASLRFPQ